MLLQATSCQHRVRDGASSHRSRSCSHVARAAQRPSLSSQLSCPYDVLGLDPTADENQIKKQYRKLAKQYHPDVNQSADSTKRFVNISEAYEFLLMQLRNKDSNGNPRPGNSEAFHDWYWSFRMSRSWAARQQQAKEGGTAAGHTYGPSAQAAAPQSAAELRSQLAGLRHRAAIRRQKANNSSAASAGASCSDSEDGPCTVQPSAEVDQGMFAVAAEGPSDCGDPTGLAMAAEGSEQQQPLPPKPKFVANNDAREALKQQLHGMRRKAKLRQQFTSTQEYAV